jgi:hypothetical protein
MIEFGEEVFEENVTYGMWHVTLGGTHRADQISYR